MQIIIVLETNSKDGSDSYYVKAILDRFYQVRGGAKISYVYLNGKGNYDKINKKTKILINKYQGESKVLFFVDVDCPNINYDQKIMNKEIEKYCNNINCELVWFKRNIEEVLTGYLINDDKCNRARNYLKNNEIDNLKEGCLSKIDYLNLLNKESNVLTILDKYLKRLNDNS